MKRKIIATGVATVALALGAGACTTGGGQVEGGGTDTGPAVNQPSITADKARGDLKVKKVTIGDAYRIGDESLPYADVAITNTSDKSKQYEYEIEVVRADNGDRIDTLYGSVDHVLPGQTVDTGDGDGQEDALSTLTENIKPVPVKWRVLYVDRYA